VSDLVVVDTVRNFDTADLIGRHRARRLRRNIVRSRDPRREAPCDDELANHPETSRSLTSIKRAENP
jgi:hypothetical protein